MRKLLNTLYITTESAWLSLDGETVVVNYEDGSKKPIPLHTVEGIISFSYKGASPSLLGKCVESGISFTSFSPHGRFLFHLDNETNGNVLLRREQYRVADDASRSLQIIKNMVAGKLFNSKYMLHRCIRSHGSVVNVARLDRSADTIGRYSKDCLSVENKESLRGIEGNAAAEYFGVFDEMILKEKEFFERFT